MRAEHRAQPLARAVRPAGNDHPLAKPLQRADVLRSGGHQLLGQLRALDGEAPALLALEIDLDEARRLRLREGREQPDFLLRKPPLPLLRVKIKRVRRQRLVGRRPERAVLQPFLARVVVVGDGLQPVVLRILRQMIERDHRVRQVVEQRIHMRIKQRQPVLHARIAAAGRHRFIKRVVALAWPE